MRKGEIMDKNDVKNRFEKISGGMSGNAVIIDKETGIEYLKLIKITTKLNL